MLPFIIIQCHNSIIILDSSSFSGTVLEETNVMFKYIFFIHYSLHYILFIFLPDDSF